MHLPQLLPVVLVHGGLFEHTTPMSYWTDAGVTEALAATTTRFIAPKRPAKPSSWEEERDVLLAAIDKAGFDQVALVGASKGCSAAARLAVDHPDRVSRLMLAWPATAGDQVLDDLSRIVIEDLAGPDVADNLLAGDTIHGVSDAELSTLPMPLVVVPSIPASHAHQRDTATKLVEVHPDSYLAGGTPDPLDRQFGDHLDDFIRLVQVIAVVEHDD